MDRREMANVLEEHLRNVNVLFDREEKYPKGKGPLKTYVVEAHARDGTLLSYEAAADLLRGLSQQSGLQLRQTRDDALFQVSCGQVGFFFDVLDPRFWVIHTMSNIKPSEDVLTTFVEKYPWLDWTWPTAQLMRAIQRSYRPLGFAVDFDETGLLPDFGRDQVVESEDVLKMRLGGTIAAKWLEHLEGFGPEFLAFSMVKFARGDDVVGSYIINELNHKGRLKAAGNSIDLHLQTVSSFLHEYKSLVLRIEEAARIYTDNSGVLFGEPLVFNFPSPLRNFEYFVKELVSCREPLKIWGIVEALRSDFVHIEGVDLHTGSRLRFDVSKDYIRVYLTPSACGNSVARLLRNLQGHIDSTIAIDLPVAEFAAS